MAENADPAGDEREDESIAERIRGMGVGTEDPNIIGDAQGGVDVAPGTDPPIGSGDVDPDELPPESED